MPIKVYPNVISLVQTIRMNGGVPKSVKYQKGKTMYENILEYIETTFKCTHKQAMDATKYFMF